MTVKIQGERGLAFARLAQAIAFGKGNMALARGFAQSRWPEHPSIAEAFQVKAAVPGASTGGWGDDLVPTAIATDFIEAVRALTVIDRLPTRRAPFQIPVPRETTAPTTGGWVGGSAIPVAAGAFDQVQLPSYVGGAIAVVSNELIASTRPEHSGVVRDILVGSLVGFLDRQFLDPAVALVAGAHPASITNGASEISSTGATAAAMLVDFRNMVEAIGTNFVEPRWIMSRRDATRVASTLTAGGALAFPTVTALGGTLLGIAVLTSASVPSAAGSPATDRYITLIDAASILVAGEGRASVQASRLATLQQDSAPTQAASASPSPTNTTSLFQTESSGVKVTREISWLRAHSGSVAYMRVSY